LPTEQTKLNMAMIGPTITFSSAPRPSFGSSASPS
jgi:hypothetical protein